MSAIETKPNDFDEGADAEIRTCLDPDNPRSFFLYAGAGSGKTRSLKQALDTFRQDHGAAFRRSGQKIAVITYTNAAADEIAERVGQDALFPISTIHSFCWQHIKTFHSDIRSWLREALEEENQELVEKSRRGRAGTKAMADRERAIEKNTHRLDWLNVPRQFTYNPNGDNFGQNSLSHTEVLKITTSFIMTRPSMQAILVNRYPFLLIDESQDTNKALLDAIFHLADQNEGKFAVGLFGDTMQRIYGDGHPELETRIPETWARPVKQMNHRSPRRVIELGNSLRESVDGQKQVAREDSEPGFIRLFVVSNTIEDKPKLEKQVREHMADLSGDADWNLEPRVKTLALEHHMTASRCGFIEMFQALDQDPRLGTGLRNGDLPGLRFFTELVLPLVIAARADDRFAVMAHLRAKSPLLNRPDIVQASPQETLPLIRSALEELLTLELECSATPFLSVLESVAKYGLFNIPAALRPFVTETPPTVFTPLPGDTQAEEGGDPGQANLDTSSDSLEAWRAFLETPYKQIVPYADYVLDRGPFGTHQGVKGLEFDRVLVILDDRDARGFLFSYDKVFGAKPLSDTDNRHRAEGTEGTIDRTRRLLYVTCTRARKSLALVAYSENPDTVIQSASANGWFLKDEIVRL